MDAIRTGIFPHADSLENAQKEYVEQRESGMYNPLIGGVPTIESPGAEEDRKVQKQAIKNTQVQNLKNDQQQNQQKAPTKEKGRPTGATAKDLYSRKNLQDVIYKIEKLRTAAAKEIKKKFKVKRLNEQQNKTIDSLVESIVVSTASENWESSLSECIKNPEKMSSFNTLNEVLEISAEHQLPDYPSAILFHSKKL